MGKKSKRTRHTEEFKIEAVKQIRAHGHSAHEVSKRRGVPPVGA